MACNFSIPITSNPETMLIKAKSAVQGQGGTFEGDSNNGHFNVSVLGNTITGSYTISNGSLDITITDKPFLVSCGMIESYLKGQIS